MLTLNQLLHRVAAGRKLPTGCFECAFPWTTIVLSIWSLQCTSPSQPDTNAYFLSLETPVVTGVHVTTVNYPDGTGQVIGTPAYSVEPGAPNIFPNPYSDPDYNSWRLYVTLNHLPPEATLVIVLGRLPGDRTQDGTSTVGVTLPSAKATVVRTLKKNDPSRFMTWDLDDNMGRPVPTGVYRVYYYGPSIDGIHFLDISIVRKQVDIYRW